MPAQRSTLCPGLTRCGTFTPALGVSPLAHGAVRFRQLCVCGKICFSPAPVRRSYPGLSGTTAETQSPAYFENTTPPHLKRCRGRAPARCTGILYGLSSTAIIVPIRGNRRKRQVGFIRLSFASQTASKSKVSLLLSNGGIAVHGFAVLSISPSYFSAVKMRAENPKYRRTNVRTSMFSCPQSITNSSVRFITCCASRAFPQTRAGTCCPRQTRQAHEAPFRYAHR